MGPDHEGEGHIAGSVTGCLQAAWGVCLLGVLDIDMSCILMSASTTHQEVHVIDWHRSSLLSAQMRVSCS